MRVFIFENNISSFGGLQRIINNISNNLVEEYDVTVVSTKLTNIPECYEYKDSVKRIYLTKKSKTVNRGKVSKINIFFRKVRNKLNQIFIINRKMKKIIKGIKNDDLLIFGRVQTAIDYLPYLNKNNKIIMRDALIYDCHNDKQKEKIKVLLNDYVDLFIVSSDESKKIYENNINRNHRAKIIKLYNPLAITPKNCFDYISKRIITVGRYDLQKGYDFLLEVFKEVHKALPEYKLDIIGAKSEELEKMVLDYNLGDCVKLYNEKSDIVSLINNSTLCICTSRYEGYANSVVETISCGIPTISVDWYCGVEEIINDNINGEIYHLINRWDYFKFKNNSEDVKDFSNKIVKLLKDNNKMELYSRNGSKIIDSRKEKLIIDKWISEIKSLENENN